jgi:hypothetical protein
VICLILPFLNDPVSHSDRQCASVFQFFKTADCNVVEECGESSSSSDVSSTTSSPSSTDESCDRKWHVSTTGEKACVNVSVMRCNTVQSEICL